MTRVRTREWSSTDYYAVLGVMPDATPAAIDATYREHAKTLHPDRNPNSVDQERFKQIGSAYAALRDPQTRSAYDDFRAQVEAGTLYARTAPPAPSPVDHLAQARVPKPRRPMPVWARHAIAGMLVAVGLAAGLWAALGDLPAPMAADTPVAVQITLAIVAVKLVAGGAAVAWYPQLRARWHH